MPTDQIVALLIAERDRLSRAIEALQGPTKRRGRPPKNPLAATPSASTPPLKKHGRRFSAAQRKAASERMRLRWAAKRKAEVKPTATPQPTTKKRTFTAARRKAQGARMKAFWAAKRKAEAKAQPKMASKSKKKAKAA